MVAVVAEQGQVAPDGAGGAGRRPARSKVHDVGAPGRRRVHLHHVRPVRGQQERRPVLRVAHAADCRQAAARSSEHDLAVTALVERAPSRRRRPAEQPHRRGVVLGQRHVHRRSRAPRCSVSPPSQGSTQRQQRPHAWSDARPAREARRVSCGESVGWSLLSSPLSPLSGLSGFGGLGFSSSPVQVIGSYSWVGPEADRGQVALLGREEDQADLHLPAGLELLGERAGLARA